MHYETIQTILEQYLEDFYFCWFLTLFKLSFTPTTLTKGVKKQHFTGHKPQYWNVQYVLHQTMQMQPYPIHSNTHTHSTTHPFLKYTYTNRAYTLHIHTKGVATGVDTVLL